MNLRFKRMISNTSWRYQHIKSKDFQTLYSYYCQVRVGSLRHDQLRRLGMYLDRKVKHALQVPSATL